MKAQKFTKEQEQEMIAFYLAPSSLNDVVPKFNLKSGDRFIRVLTRNRIEKRSNETYRRFSN